MKPKNKEQVYISLCFDKNYLPHVKTIIKSIVENNENLQITFCLFFGGNEDVLKNSNITEFVDKLGKKIKYWILDKSTASNLKSCSYLGKAAYYRLYIPKLLLKSNIDKTLYIDCDIINNGKIDKIFSTDINDKYFAVCFENPNNTTFNTGVMLINCRKWEKDNLSEKLIEFIEDNPDKIVVGDQSALNLVVKKEDYLILPPRNNLTIQYWYYIKSVLSKKEIKEEIKKAVFYHFNGRQKPRNYFCEHPYFKIRYIYMENISLEMKIIYVVNYILISIGFYQLKFIYLQILQKFKDQFLIS